MADAIPFIPSDNNYRLVTSFDGTRYLVDVHWNSVDGVGAWYFDLREEDETPIRLGIKVVLGVNLGRASTHKFFQENILRAIDTSNAGLDAGYDDLGARVIVVRTKLTDLGA